MSLKHALLALLGCTSVLATAASPAGAETLTGVRTGAYYNYVPSGIRRGDRLQLWWCGLGPASDNIFFQEIDLEERSAGPIVSAIQPTPAAWDSLHTCDPSVIRGRWTYEGRTYTYAMYYTGTDDPANQGATNGIGVAYSNDGRTWVKYPYSVYRNPRTQPPSYGIGQQAVLSTDGASAISLIVNDVRPNPDPNGPPNVSDWKLFHSADGLRFTPAGHITKAGLITTELLQADFALDRAAGYVYMVTDRNGDQSKIDLYRIPLCNLTKPAARWAHLETFSSETTDQPFNQGAGFVRDERGNLSGLVPDVSVVFSSGPVKDVNTQTLLWQETVRVTTPPAAACDR